MKSALRQSAATLLVVGQDHRLNSRVARQIDGDLRARPVVQAPDLVDAREGRRAAESQGRGGQVGEVDDVSDRRADTIEAEDDVRVGAGSSVAGIEIEAVIAS